eukprot:130833_1
METKNTSKTEIKKKNEKWQRLTYHKCCNGRFDANALFLIIGIILIFFPWIIRLSFEDKTNANYYVTITYLILNGYLIFCLLFAMFCFFWYLVKVLQFKDKNYAPFITPDTKHIVQILWYNEPISIIEETIDYIKQSQFMVITDKIIIAIAFEDVTKDIELKQQHITNKYGEYFLDIIYTIHPSELPNNTRGACSNVTWSTKEIYKYLVEKDGDSFNDKQYILTKFDSDTLMHPKYLASLEYHYLNALKMNNGKCDTIFVPKLCYEYSLNNRYWFVGALARFRMFFYNWVNFLDWTIVTVYSIPLNLHNMGGFQCPYNAFEEYITWLKYSIFNDDAIKVRVIPHYIVNGPTVGDTLKQEIHEMGVQYARWSMQHAQAYGVILKYLFTGNLSIKNVFKIFMRYTSFLVGFLFLNSFAIFIFISHAIYMNYYFGISSLLHGGLAMMSFSIFWGTNMLVTLFVAVTPRYFIKNEIIWLSEERKKSTLKPVCLMLVEMLLVLVPVSIGNVYTVKKYFDGIMYGQSAYGH